MKRLTAFLISATLAAPSLGASAADDFGAQRSPSRPVLGVDAEPGLCKKLLVDANEMFASRAADLNLAAAIARDFPPIEWQAIPSDGEPFSGFLGYLEVDLDGTGHKQVIAYRDNVQSWRGDWHYAYVFPSPDAFTRAKRQVLTAWKSTPESSQYPDPGIKELGSQEYYPTGLDGNSKATQTGDVWAEHSLFAWQKKYYFVAGTTEFDRERPSADQIFRIRANGHVELVCVIQQGNFDQAYERFQQLPSMGAFLKSIRLIGAGGTDSGTMHSGTIHDAQATAAEIRASVRPWATSAERPAPGDGFYYRYDARTADFLELWSFEELWNRREYQTLREMIGPAEDSYSRFLQSEFGVPAAKAHTAAVAVIEQIIGARLLIPHEFSPNQVDLYFPDNALHQAVMHRDKAAFDLALAPEGSYRRDPGAASDLVSDAVRDAVEWPYGLEQLLKTADPNRANWFGKTALMVAAHLNRVDAVRSLLKAGADVKAVTRAPEGAWMEGPKRSGRTALMYAAENAGPSVIKALIDAGADPNARDSEGNGVQFYLSNNPRFTDGEKTLGLLGIARKSEEFAGSSFDCGNAHTAVERTICTSEVLRIFDAEIARAFEALLKGQGTSIKDQQRVWLQLRDRSCRSVDSNIDADCLAEVLRTHERYLQYRLSERRS